MSSTTNKRLKRKQQSGASFVELERHPEKIGYCVSNILDIPKEILIKIILLLNARERIGLGNSCKQFNSLVFEEEELLRNLDFSKDGHFTLASEVQQYFDNENGRDKILKVNMRNTKCMKPGRMLNNSIGQASNLVDINIHGIEFKDIWQFGSFINSMPNVRRLSFDWSEARDSCILMCYKILQHPFSSLKYLSVEMKEMACLKVFTPCLRLCPKLEKLRLVVKKSSETSYSDSWSVELEELKNLKVVEYRGPLATQIKERFGTVLPNPENWVDFKLDCSSKPRGFHLCIVDICKELVDSKWMERVQNIMPQNHSKLGWCLVPELLLKEVLQITCENAPEEFCCFSKFMDMERCLLKIDEAKRLLKNPKSQISYLYAKHPIDLGCDVHLVVSAFSNLTELVLAAITRNQESYPMASHFQRRLILRGNVPEKLDAALNMDSSFKMLVENTRYLRHFTLGGFGSYENWDLEELHLIPKWKFLQSLRLLDVPIEDGEFLIEIGKHCKNLENLELMRLGPREKCCYESQLIEMLTHCQNLRNFSIMAANLSQISKLFSSLTNSKQLRRVRINTAFLKSDDCHQYYLKSSIVQLLRQCPKLTKFLGEFNCPKVAWYSREGLLADQQSWIEEQNRPHLQIKMRHGSTVAGTVSEDSPHFNPFPDMWMTI